MVKGAENGLNGAATPSPSQEDLMSEVVLGAGVEVGTNINIRELKSQIFVYQRRISVSENRKKWEIVVYFSFFSSPYF